MILLGDIDCTIKVMFDIRIIISIKPAVAQVSHTQLLTIQLIHTTQYTIIIIESKFYHAHAKHNIVTQALYTITL